jgi:hypothetical protein
MSARHAASKNTGFIWQQHEPPYELITFGTGKRLP